MATWRGTELTTVTLRSARLILRPWQAGDAAAVTAVMADPRMHSWLRLPKPYDLQAATTFVTATAPGKAASGTGVDLAVVDRDDGRLIGAAGLHELADESPVVEIGYWTGVADWHRGYATEATRALTDFAFSRGAVRSQIRCHVDNIASASVALASGYQFEGISRLSIPSSSGLADGASFGRLSTDPDLSIDPLWPPLGELSDGVIVLRPAGPGDELVELAETVNPAARFWALSDVTLTPDEARRRAEHARLRWLIGPQSTLIICDATDGAGAGTITLRRSGPPDVVGIGYGVLPAFRGRQFTSRALTLLADWLFGHTTIHRLELGLKTGNTASARSAERAGFVHEGTYRQRLRNVHPDAGGGYSDEERYALIRPAPVLR
ncbi:hypothetical protein BH10ACT8_BH10ACT8_23730 [soil metagenome]